MRADGNRLNASVGMLGPERVSICLQSFLGKKKRPGRGRFSALRLHVSTGGKRRGEPLIREDQRQKAF